MAIGAVDCELVGCMSKDRYLAAVFDNSLAGLAAFLAAVKLASYGPVASWSAAAATYIAYFLLSEVLLGNSFGKWFCGLRIRTLMGHRATRWQLLIRTIFRILEVNPLLLGGLPAAIAITLTPKRQRVGDLLAGTMVVRCIARP